MLQYMGELKFEVIVVEVCSGTVVIVGVTVTWNELNKLAKSLALNRLFADYNVDYGKADQRNEINTHKVDEPGQLTKRSPSPLWLAILMQMGYVAAPFKKLKKIKKIKKVPWLAAAGAGLIYYAG